MGNVNMEARQIHYRGGEKPMSVEEAIKAAGSEISTVKSGLTSYTITTYDFNGTPSGYNNGGIITVQKMAGTVIVRFVDYVPISGSGEIELLSGLPTAKGKQSGVILTTSGTIDTFKIEVNNDKLYSYYNSDHSSNTSAFSGQLVYLA